AQQPQEDQVLAHGAYLEIVWPPSGRRVRPATPTAAAKRTPSPASAKDEVRGQPAGPVGRPGNVRATISCRMATRNGIPALPFRRLCNAMESGGRTGPGW